MRQEQFPFDPTCGHASTRRETFLDISLPIPLVVPPPGSAGGGVSGAVSPRAAAAAAVAAEEEPTPSSPPQSQFSPSPREMPEVGEGPGGCATLQQCLVGPAGLHLPHHTPARHTPVKSYAAFETIVY